MEAIQGEIEKTTDIIYVGDPMCSWCWGFAPTLERLVADHDIPFQLVVGGLRPGRAAASLGDGLRSTLIHHWDQVAAASRQPFDTDALNRRPDTWMYDTELADTAVVVMRAMAPAQTLDFFIRLQRAFYAEGVDLTDLAAYPDLLDGFDVDVSSFVAALSSDDAKQGAYADFAWSRERNIRGFPTTLLRTGERLRMLAAGYQSYRQLHAVFHAALDRFAPDADVGCSKPDHLIHES